MQMRDGWAEMIVQMWRFEILVTQVFNETYAHI